MAIISSIRKRGGILVGIIAVALLSFVLGDVFISGQSMFGSEQNMGEIAGNPISVIAFDNEVQYIADVQKERRKQAALDEETLSAIRDNVWEKFVKNLALKPQFTVAGISVSDAEIKELILGNDPDPLVVNYFSDPQTQQLIPYFRDQMTGKLNPASVKTYVDSLPEQEKFRWTEFEEALRDAHMQNKYLSLVKKGIYVTTIQAKEEYQNLNTTVSFKYMVKPYSSLADSLVEINDRDKLKFYNENRYKFKQQASRKLEYLIFDIKPVEQDFLEVKTQMENLAEEWKSFKEEKEDSLFVVREGESRWFDTTFYEKGQLPLKIDSLAHASEKGTLLPIYIENNQYKLSKVINHKSLPDSVKARHILIKVEQGDTLGKKIVNTRIDSIKNVITKQKNFAELAAKFGEDGTKEKGGDLGWFGVGAMVQEFQYACFHGKKGDLFTVYTQFGWHVIEITDQSPYSLRTQVATIDLTIEPGTKTRQDIYNKAVDFITKYHSSETFEKGVEEEHLVKRFADPLKENDKVIAGIENPREIIRWAFNSEKGAVTTEPFSFPDKYVVAHLSEIREEGIAPIDQKKEEVEIGARKMKKAEKFIEEMNKIGASSIEDFGSKMNLSVLTGDGANFTSYSVPNIGKEMNVYGPLFSLKEGQTSKPINGESGVYVVKVEKITPAPPTTDYSAAKNQAKNNFTYRADMEVVEALKKLAEIQDNRAKFF